MCNFKYRFILPCVGKSRFQIAQRNNILPLYLQTGCARLLDVRFRELLLQLCAIKFETPNSSASSLNWIEELSAQFQINLSIKQKLLQQQFHSQLYQNVVLKLEAHVVRFFAMTRFFINYKKLGWSTSDDGLNKKQI